MSDQTNFKENMLTVRKQGKKNKFSYFKSNSRHYCIIF